MTLGRREFVRAGLLATGAAAVGIGATAGAPDEASGAPAKTAGDGPSDTVALTPDGRLVAVRAVTQVPAPQRTWDAARRGVPGRKWVMVIDLAKCDGCGECVKACRKGHFTPSDREWIRLYKMRESEETAPYWFPKPCFHCDDPPCCKVCPVGATFKREDGIVLVDNTRCIGCRFCMAACPYSSRVFNWGQPTNPSDSSHVATGPGTGMPRYKGTTEKCDFCASRLAEGELTHCTEACPMGAIYIGDQNEDAVTSGTGSTLQLSKLLRDRAGYRHLEDLGTQPRVFYLPPTNRRYAAPGEPGAETGNVNARVRNP
jgi:molybdopterin-containing oxidoreductase family iron-sulfur binding subunit